MSVTYTPTQAVSNNQMRAKALSNSSNKNVKNVVKGLRLKDVDLSGELTIDDIKDIYSNFLALEKKVDLKKCLSKGEAPSSTIGWYYNGGQAGLSWCRSILKSEGILKSYGKEITKQDLNLEGESRWNKTPVAKSVNTELKQVTYVAMQEGVDLQGDLTTLDEIRKAKENFNKSMMKANLFHLTMTNSFEIIESYLAPTDMVLNDNLVTKGTWLVTLQVFDDQLWEMVKSGDICGVSIGALANVEEIDDGQD